MARSSSRQVGVRIGRRRWTAEQASVVLVAASRSGLPLRAFAARHGLDPQRLYRWRRELVEAAGPVESVGFEEVRVDSAPDGPDPDERIEVELPSGHLVRLGTGSDDGALRRLLVVLDEAGGC